MSTGNSTPPERPATEPPAVTPQDNPPISLAPQDNPPISVTEAKSNEQGNSHSSSVTESDYGYEWRNHGRHGREWSPSPEWKGAEWPGEEYWPPSIEGKQPPNWADAPPDTPRKIAEEATHSAPKIENKVATPPPSPVEIESQPITTAITAPNAPDVSTDPVINSSIRVEKVTVHRTQSVEVTRPSETQTMIALQRLALTGPPLTREDRLARQSLANRLTLSPQLYNLLVLGEDEEGHLPEQIEDGPPTCAAPPGTASLHSP